jgi:hypothetical protein
VDTTTTIPASAWTHVAAVRTNTSTNGFQLYINGVSSATATVSTDFNQTDTLYIGGDRSAANVMNGYISGLKYTNGTAETISVPTTPPTATTNVALLTNFTNAGIYDATSKNDLETVGNAQISNTTAKWGSTSIKFDGTGDALVSPYSVNYQLGTGDFTVEMWFYIAANSDQDAGGNRNATVIESRDVTGTTNGMFVIIQGNATTTGTGISFGIRIGGTTYSYAYTGSISQTTWQHLAVVRSGTTCTTYLNGTSVASNSSFGYDIQSVSNMNIGSSPITGFTRVLNGYLQDVRITKGYARYTANFTAPTAPFPTL